MPRAEQVQPSFSFVKGIITEASPLTFPENATIDEENFELDVSGRRSRRLGMDFETSSTYLDTNYGTTNTLSNYVTQTYRWDNVNNDPTVSLLVVRVGQFLRFFDLFQDSQSPNEVTGPGFSMSADGIATFSAVNGLLVVGIENTPLIYVFSYDSGVITADFVNPVVRDIWGLDDALEVDERPSTLSILHEYNLKNQGWTDGFISNFTGTGFTTWQASRSYSGGEKLLPTVGTGFYYTANVDLEIGYAVSGSSEPTWPTTLGTTVVDGGVTWTTAGSTTGGTYPSNADIVSLGEKDDGTWDFDLIKDYLLGNTPAPKGKYQVNLFSMGADRVTESGISGLPAERQDGAGFKASAAYAGRVFIGGITGSALDGDSETPRMNGFILFSQLVKNKSDINKFYQQADPTADELNELVATDGGFINITEAIGIHKLVPIHTSLLVFAENGVWEIRGGESGFSAVDFQVNKITDVGSINPATIVPAEDSVLYWTKGGIYIIQPDQSQTLFISKDLTEDTIQTLFTNIPSASKAKAQGHYTTEDKTARWIYNSDGDEVKYTYDTELVFDFKLQAFSKLKYTQPTENSPEVCGIFSTPNLKVEASTEVVVDEVGATVVDSLGADVTIDISRRVNSSTALKYVTLEKPTSGNWRYTFSQRTDTSFVDWATFGDSVDAPAFMETGYDIAGDSMRYKQVPYINFHFLRTETGFNPDFSLANPSGCLVQAKWDWSEHPNSGKIGTQFQAYRLPRNYVPVTIADDFNEGHVVVTSKNKLRGRGRALSLRIDTEAAKDCQLLGWSLVMNGNTKV